MNRRYYEEKEITQSNYVAKKNQEQMDNDNLTKKQHEVIQELCSIRHEMHVNSKDIFNGDSAIYREVDQWLGGIMAEEENTINYMLREAGLPIIKNLKNYDEIETSGTYDFDIEREEYKTEEEYEQARIEAKDRAIEEISEIAEHNDKVIIEYLRNIDKEYDTEYAPTGHSRGNYLY